MKISYENKLAIKITIVLFLLLIFSFSIFIVLNYKLALKREKNLFLENLKSVPSEYIINLIKWDNLHNWVHYWFWKTIYKKIFRNFYVKIWNKEFKRWIFIEDDIKNKIINNLQNKQIKVFSFPEDKILAYELKSKTITLIIWKNIDYIFDSIHRLILISFILSIFSLFILYFISLKLAYKTTKNIKLANKKLQEYNYNVAHELKTPLSVIKSDLELLSLSEKIDLDIIKSIQEESLFMQEIIDSLLFLSENDNVIQNDFIDLKEEIKNIIWKYFSEYKKDFKISWKDIWKIKVNRKLFDLLLKNLFENTIKYRWRPKKINIFLEKDKLIIKNKVSKDIKDLDISKVFNTFYKADNSRNTNWYWLWLNIVKKIIKIHNFDIKVELNNNFFIIKIIFS